ncbi:MAG: hypothetical protein HFF00_04850 [Ruminiclostridium sp.]|jgi:hypothetical protein|nr:hypothetical protein [Ruminiclostridium sp.]
MPVKEEWRDIPGYGGWYQISTEGRIRSFRKGHGEKDTRAETPKLMTPRLLRNIKSSSACLRIRLVDVNGNQVFRYMATLMADTWIGPRPPGYNVCIKNNNPEDVRLSNLCIMKRSDITRLKTIGPKTIRRKLPVVKIDKFLEVVDAYPSARQAALASGIPPNTLKDYCNRKVKRTVFAPDGYIYCWDDSRIIWATLRRAMQELDELGLRYNNPFTGRYFDLPQDDDLDIDSNELWWTQALALAEGQLQKDCGVMP